MKFKIVADSSSCIFDVEDCNYYSSVPLKIISNKEYVDTKELNVRQMVDELKVYKGKTGSSCPNCAEWVEAFGDADGVFAITITSRLSGSYDAACMAKKEYEEAHPGAKVKVIDSLSAGPQLKMLVDKIVELINEGKDYDIICTEIDEYFPHAQLLFSLQSVDNLAKNGRVNPVIAMAVNALGIRIVGIALDGRLEQLHKVRGEKKAMNALYEEMKARKFTGSKVLIGHCFNKPAVELLSSHIKADHPECHIEEIPLGGLCSFYAEEGGLMVGFEVE